MPRREEDALRAAGKPTMRVKLGDAIKKRKNEVELSRRRQDLFAKHADYFVSECGWDSHVIALGFVLACGAHRNNAVEMATELVSNWRRKRKKEM
jgi:hypothetical protein